MRVLLITKSPIEGAYLHKALRECAHSVQSIDNMRDGFYLASQESYAAVLIVTEDKGGDEVLENTLKQFSELADKPAIIVVLMSANAAERARLLRAGADACFVHPYSFTEMQERLMALQRGRQFKRQLHAGDVVLRLDAQTHELTEGSRRMPLTKGEYLLIECLLAANDRPVSREQLIHYAWPDKEEVEPASVSLVVSRLRRKFTQYGLKSNIETVSRFGYQLKMGR